MSRLNLENVEGDLASQWRAVADAFLVSAPGWPGGEANVNRVLDWITAHDLADATDKNAVLRLAVTELTAEGRIKTTLTADSDVSEAAPDIKGWVV